MAAGSLTAREDDADVERLLAAYRILLTLELHNGHTVGMGEEFLDFFLISNRFRCLAYLYLNRTLQGFRELGLVLCPHSLKCTFLHFLFWGYCLLFSDCKINYFLAFSGHFSYKNFKKN